MRDINLLGISRPQTWREILERRDWHGLKDLLGYLSEEVKGIENLGPEDWGYIVDKGTSALEIAEYERAFKRMDPSVEVLQFKIVLALIDRGLYSTREETKWLAWMTLWQIDAHKAYRALEHRELTERDVYFRKEFELPDLAPGAIKLSGATQKGGKPVLFKVPKPMDLKPLMSSPRRIDRELAIRMMGSLGTH